MAEGLRIERFSGRGVVPWISAVARLRIAVFREYPYLYDGSLAYEQEYLKELAGSERSVVVVALDGDEAAGASTGMPLAEEPAELQRPFREAGMDPAAVFYCAESVLLPAYRGRGLYPRFFAEREAHARALGFAVSTFCAVERPEDHPRRPSDYRPLDGIWKRLGYARRPDLRATISWKDLDEEAESPKPMVFWVKPLIAGAV
jgi:GNAT superfamily N-acetyltransferase